MELKFVWIGNLIKCDGLWSFVSYYIRSCFFFPHFFFFSVVLCVIMSYLFGFLLFYTIIYDLLFINSDIFLMFWINFYLYYKMNIYNIKLVSIKYT